MRYFAIQLILVSVVVSNSTRAQSFTLINFSYGYDKHRIVNEMKVFYQLILDS